MPDEKNKDFMNTDDPTDLRELFRSKYVRAAPPFVEGGDLPFPVFIAPEDAKRMFVHFAAKLLRDHYTKPLRRPMVKELFKTETQPYGRLLETMILDLRLLTGSVNDALNKPQGYIERVITGETKPWELSPAEGAEISVMFRIHAELLPDLLRWSAAAFKQREAAGQSGRSLPRLEEASSEALRLLDIGAAAMNPGMELPGEAEAWISVVLAEIEKRQAYDLLN
ncbi:MAG TPA: hypothetical protein VN256_21805 [Pyrinomonadaceae bacterium]|nr:hypothetical protein [Pyrinomonadaceae bacterium]